MKLWRWREPLSPLERATADVATGLLLFNAGMAAFRWDLLGAALWLTLWVVGVVLAPRAVRAVSRWRDIKRKASRRAAESEE